MGYESYSKVNTLEELTLIGGDHKFLEFQVYNEDGTPMVLAGKTCSWAMCRYGQANGNPEFYVLTKTGTISGTIENMFTVEILSADTKSLYGKFIQQPIISDVAGNEYRPAQGIVNIFSGIANA